MLGTGIVGRSLAGGFDTAGHDVVVGTRDVAATTSQRSTDRAGNPTYSDWAREHAGVRLVPFAEAGSFGEILVNATAGAVSLKAIAAAAAGQSLDGKIVVDVANALDFSAGFPPTLTVANTDSLAEQIQRAYPAAHVVKALNTMNALVMVDPARVPGEHDVFVAGDDADAKAQVTALLGDLGWPASAVVDVGGIRAARGLEMYVILWITMYGGFGTGDFNIHVVRA